MNINRFWKIGGLFLIGICFGSGYLWAEDNEVVALKKQIDDLNRKLAALESKVMTIPKPVEPSGGGTIYLPQTPEKEGFLRTPFDIHMGGYVETQYQNNLGSGKGTNVGRSLTDRAKDTFSVNAAKLWFEKVANPEGGAGFRIDMMMGSDARYYFNNFQTNNDGTTNGGISSTGFAFEQAYVQLVAPLKFFEDSKVLPHAVDFKVGRMTTLAGNEVIEGYNNWNISRSVSFGYAIPFTHTGLRASFGLFDNFLNVTTGVNNGWDNDIDNNVYKTLENAISFSPFKNVKWTTASYFGPELNAQNGRNRFLITNVLGWDVTSKLSLAGEFDYGNQNRIDINTDGILEHRMPWYGYAAYAKYKFTDKLSAAYRFEIFDDSKRYRNWTGVGTAGAATDLGNTLTLEYKLYDNLIARGEYRIDYANAGDGNVFKGDHSQSTFGGQLIYLFG